MAATQLPAILWRGLKKNRWLSAAVLAGLAASHFAMVVTALVPAPFAFAGCALASYVLEYYALKRAEPVMTHIGAMGAGQTHRFLLRDLLVVVFMLRHGDAPAMVATVACGVLLAHLLRVVIAAAQTYVRKCRRLQVLTRNVDLSRLRIPDAPHPMLMRGGQRRQLHTTVPAVCGTVVAALSQQPSLAYAGVGVTLVWSLWWAGALLRHALRVRHLRDKAHASEVVFEELRAHAPEVVLYYSLDPKLSANAYQVDMWIPVLERLRKRYMILVRERAHVERIGRTTAPLVCLAGGSEVMNLNVPSLKVGLYVGNTGKNIHLLRHPEMKHVFVGHGDSDKAASANPFCKVYDEVFVAGPAARDRFHSANSGVSDEVMAEVGRPQLDEIEQRRPDGIFTVLYAPTWEGWTADTDVTSVTHMGPQLVRQLLELPFPVRVIYKPHPLTGVRDRATKEAHKEILRILKEANEITAAREDPRVRAECEVVKDERDKLRREYAQATAKPSRTDSTHRARDNWATDPADKAELDDAAWRISRLFWRIHPQQHHRIVLDASPQLYDCFNESHMMISDVSSVVSDYIMSQKPYVVANPGAVAEEDFTAQVTTARGAYLLSPDCAELDEIVSTVHDTSVDPKADQRLKTQRYLLGEEPARAQESFGAAVDALAEKANRP